jgi:hypothetical protein
LQVVLFSGCDSWVRLTWMCSNSMVSI